MKVSAWMHKALVTTTEDESVEKVVKMIFNFGISGVPVLRNKKLVGIVTEADILSKLFPTIKEFMEDYEHSRDFEAMESKLADLMQRPVRKLMSRSARTVNKDVPLMHAQSLMLVHNISRLPVVDDEGQLVGIISQGDIFRALAGSEIPLEDNEEYHQWLSRHYDLVVPWEKRLSVEIPDLDNLLTKYKARTVIDIFTGTGEHAIALAKKNYSVLGLNEFRLMHETALDKYKKLPSPLQGRLTFYRGDYIASMSRIPDFYDSAIIMGNALAHSPDEYEQIIRSLGEHLAPTNSLIVLQIANIEKVLSTGKRLQDFNIASSKLSDRVEYAFVEFYDPPNNNNKYAVLTMEIMANRGRRWSHIGTNSTRIAYLTRDNVSKLLKSAGFKNITLYGSRFTESLFGERFKPQSHDWLNIVATR